MTRAQRAKKEAEAATQAAKAKRQPKQSRNAARPQRTERATVSQGSGSQAAEREAERAIGSRFAGKEEIIEAILLAVATTNYGMRKICEREGYPDVSTFREWCINDATLAARYTRAREHRMEVLADEIVEISDDAANDTMQDEDGRTVTNHDHITRSRLRVDTRKWLMSKLAPRYSDRQQVELTGNLGVVPLTAEERAARLRQIDGEE